MLGDISAKYESGNRGAKTISQGKGDPGGVSYGTYQLASKTGTLQAFLIQSGYHKDFQGLIPGTLSFNNKWIELCNNSDFVEAQYNFIKQTHYDPLLKFFESISLNFLDVPALQEALWSISVQHSLNGCKKIIAAALRTLSNQYTIQELIYALYQARTNYVTTLGLSYLKKRYDNELNDVIALLNDPQKKVQNG